MSPSESSSSSTPFAESMRGQQPHPEDRQFPAMLQDLYATAAQRREGGAETLPPCPTAGGAWTTARCSRQASTLPCCTTPNGFDAAFYRNDQGQVVLGFCGTDEGKD